MIDFEAELDKLLTQEGEPLPQSELTELAAAGKELLAALNKKQTDFTMQIEEIYDLLQEADTNALGESLRDEKARANRLAATAVGLCDILEDFCAYARGSGHEDLERQALLMWKNAGGLLESCGIARLGEEGQPLDPALHTVQTAVASPLPREHVARVLQSGYRYLGAVVRRAVVVVSTGTEETGNE